MSTNIINCIIADDSAFLRQILKDILHQSRSIKVIGEAKNGVEAIKLVKSLPADVLILDCEMPVMNGLQAIRRIMAIKPIPIFMFSSLTAEGASVSIKALEYGAVDVFLKPRKGLKNLENISQEMIQKIEIVSIRNRLRTLTNSGPHKSAVNFNRILNQIRPRKIDLIAVGSSTGGVKAMQEVVTHLPAETKPILWVQHIQKGFSKGLSERLNGQCKIKVKEAEDGDHLEANTCYLAPFGRQMRVKKSYQGFKLELLESDSESGHCPSCTVLFESVAEHFSKNALGVILTGMGDDGAKGLALMHKNGSLVLGQDEESSVVYGMPKVPFDQGVVDFQLPIDLIADGIKKAVIGMSN